MKKTARARENLSLHCQEGLKEVSMATPVLFCRFDHCDWCTISEIQRSGRWLAAGKVAALAWVKREVPGN